MSAEFARVITTVSCATFLSHLHSESDRPIDIANFCCLQVRSQVRIPGNLRRQSPYELPCCSPRRQIGRAHV